ncbi:MAG TPA: hypothetical protein VL171_16565 [Verrucomicrobiae bacterium]|nr:hypothetical protein [Verrucomicrobiae bacterium]
MTVVSIIQSFALGYLFTVIGDRKDKLFQLDNSSIIIWLEAWAVFQIIVMNWHVTAQNVAIFARVYDWIDSYVPFLFAIPEYAMIACIKEGNIRWWFYWLAVFVALALAANIEMCIDVSRNEPENAEIFRRLRTYFVGVSSYFGFGVFLFGAMGYYGPHLTLGWQTVLVLVTILLFHVFAFGHHFLCWKRAAVA